MPDVMEVVPSRQFAQRVTLEQTAALRSSPVPGHISYRPPSTRDARIRLEIDLALRVAAAKARQRPRTEDAPPPPIYVVSTPTARVPAVTARPRMQVHGPPLPALAGSQVTTSIAAAGSKSTRGLMRGATRFKNMESPLPLFNNAD